MSETPTLHTPTGVRVLGPIRPGYETILTHDALAFVADLCKHFSGRLNSLLHLRADAQQQYDAGMLPHFLAATASVREGDWTVAPVPEVLHDRRVEITGPPDRKMVINALNSGAKVFMADFEDSSAPTWANQIEGQINLRDAVAGTITYEHPTKGVYRLNPETAVLFVRPRGLHLTEAHLEVFGQRAPASLVDFGLFLFHNAAALLAKGAVPSFYLPKLESYLEARWWNQVFVRAQERLGLPVGTIKATVLVETLPASFQLDEILWELKDHSAGLNCGRWDYIFSYIKTLRAHPDFVLPDRSVVGMTQPMMAAYTRRVVAVCHRRGAHAMGGMAAQIPIKDDPAANEAAMAKVRADKEREVAGGHDGTWVAHPGLVPLAMEIFDAGMPTPDQRHVHTDVSDLSEADLLKPPRGPRTEEGLRTNLRVGVQYLAAWLDGSGCVPLYNLMEDAATAEISRAQVWQWVFHGAVLDDGRKVTLEIVRALLADEVAALREVAPQPRLDDAAALFDELCAAEALAPFLTLPAYERILTLTT